MTERELLRGAFAAVGTAPTDDELGRLCDVIRPRVRQLGYEDMDWLAELATDSGTSPPPWPTEAAAGRDPLAEQNPDRDAGPHPARESATSASRRS